MEIQNIIVGLIILAAVFYAVSLAWKKSKSFSAKSSCGNDCGCGEKSKNKAVNF
ncbi:MAG: FeoB-associated Cys-rich membrane protein [Pyrinomonadaceae bacterium]